MVHIKNNRTRIDAFNPAMKTATSRITKHGPEEFREVRQAVWDAHPRSEVLSGPYCSRFTTRAASTFPGPRDGRVLHSGPSHPAHLVNYEDSPKIRETTGRLPHQEPPLPSIGRLNAKCPALALLGIWPAGLVRLPEHCCPLTYRQKRHSTQYILWYDASDNRNGCNVRCSRSSITRMAT